jgi:TIR domain/Pentapeptide repeats (8 copies)
VAVLADDEHIRRLKQSVATWNTWRSESPATPSCPDLSDADLFGAYLRDANLTSANLIRTDLIRADLIGTNLSGANLSGADLSRSELITANLIRADLTSASLVDANLSGADLRGANLSGADLSGADLSNAVLLDSIFADVNLSSVIGLETCNHRGPSTLDYRTLQRSGSLPLFFLREVGLPDRLIDYLPSLFDQAIRYYSCFISYSTRDQDFADRLHADLQNKGVRCWFAPHDLPIGGKILDEIDSAIRLRDKVLLILSEHSIKSDWVEDEVKTAYEEERKRRQTVLFPIRIDDVVMDTNEAWATKLRADRNIGDFCRWKDHESYKRCFERAVRDLTPPPRTL